ncbi:MAG: hypothetical protein AAB428_01840 [Patescibacteria group bacterium]
MANDTEILDFLEKLLIGHRRNDGSDFVIHSDYENGIWVAKVRRGVLRSQAMEHLGAHKTLREAIKSLMSKVERF